MKKVAVIGANGQLGSDLCKVFQLANWEVKRLVHADISVEDHLSVSKCFEGISLDFIVNTAAMHQVALCEKEITKSWNVNSKGAQNIARVAQSIGAKVVYVSTDYVFDGNKNTPYSEVDLVSPINVYGASKASGEIATLSTSSQNLVARISSVFGSAGSSGKGGNFVETIIKKVKEREPLTIVGDIVMSPSYSLDVAQKILSLLENDLEGVFHLSNEGSSSWFDFAQEICSLMEFKVSINKSTTDNLVFPKRPINSSLNTEKIKERGIDQRGWREALKSYLIEKGHIS